VNPSLPAASVSAAPTGDLDIADAPFSRRFHWLAFALHPETGRDALYLRNARGGVVNRTLLRIELEEDGRTVPATLHVYVGRLTLTAAGSSAEFCLDGTNTARVRPSGSATLRLHVVDQLYSSTLQCETGRWHLNLNASVDFGMTKPPVHGWALTTLLRHYTPTPGELAQAYTALERWTSWWLTHRDDDHDGIPQYNHGCESGWDNDSLCCGGLPCESADLTVYPVDERLVRVLNQTLQRKTPHGLRPPTPLLDQPSRRRGCPGGRLR